jgi:hypothetical protein
LLIFSTSEVCISPIVSSSKETSTPNCFVSLTTPSITVGTGPFTFECWFYYTGTFASIAAFCGPGIVNNGSLSLYINNSTQLAIQRYGFTAALYTVPAIQVNTWNHAAFVRDSSNNMTVFLNGTRSSTGATTSTANFDFFRTIGYVNSTVLRYFSGYLSNLRCTFSAVYDPTQTTITIPTAPPSPTGSNLCLNFTNAGIIDSTADNVLQTLGNAQISTVQSKWGGSSMSFDGTGDYLYYPNNLNAQFGTGDFTIEGWIYINSLAALQVLFEFRATSGATYGQIYITTGGVLRYYLPTDVGTSNTFTTGAWTHFAITRASGTLNMYIGGTRGYTNTYTSAMDASKIQIGADVNGANGLNAYLDDVRITKGVARYTAASFTPPTSQLQSQ